MRIDELEIGFRSAFPSLLFFFPIQLLLSPFAVTYFYTTDVLYIARPVSLWLSAAPACAYCPGCKREYTRRKKKRKKEKTNR